MSDPSEYRILKAEVQREIRLAKRHAFTQFVEEIDSGMSQKQIWNKFKISRGKQRVFDVEGDGYVKVEGVRRLFESYSKPSIPAIPDTERLYGQVKQVVKQSMMQRDRGDSLNQLIGIDEVTKAIHVSPSSSSPGPDGIPYKMFKAGGDQFVAMLCRVFNLWFRSGKIPRSCDEAIQIAIPKKEAGDFRPITMKNAVVKIYERILYGRLYKYCDSSVPGYQFGFRRGVGSCDQLVRVMSYLQRNRIYGFRSVVLFLDIKKAYDRVYRKHLMLKLRRLGVKGMMWKAIDALIHNGRYRTVLKNFVSEEYTLEEGIPQGGILSPLLWNVFFADIPIGTNDNYLYGAFADDLAVITRHRDMDVAAQHMTILYRGLRRWAQQNRVEFSDRKVKVMGIIKERTWKKRGFTTGVKVTYRDDEGKIKRVEEVEWYDYLGARIDNRLVLDLWIDKIVKEMRRRINFINRIVKTMMLSRKNIKKFYQVYVRGYINYSCQIWASAKSVNRVLIEDRRGIRMCCGLLPKTKNEDLSEEQTISDISFTIRKNTTRFIAAKINGKNRKMQRMMINLIEIPVQASWTDIGRTPYLMKQIWMDANLPITVGQLIEANFCDVAEMIEQRWPKTKEVKTKYLDDFWCERLMARIRVGVLPTRSWAFKMRLSKSYLCRHCGEVEETVEHLFDGSCSKINTEELQKVGMFSFQDVKSHLWSFQSKDACQDVMQAVVKFVKYNNLWKKGGMS